MGRWSRMSTDPPDPCWCPLLNVGSYAQSRPKGRLRIAREQDRKAAIFTPLSFAAYSHCASCTLGSEERETRVGQGPPRCHQKQARVHS